MSKMLEVHDVSKTYGRGESTVRALQGASLSVEQGESVLVMGPSGSGKTTLLLICGTLLRPDEGVVTIDGSDVTKMRESTLPDFRLSKIGFIFQQFNLLPALTALQNVEFVLNARGLKGKAARELAMESLAKVGLRNRANHLPEDMSGGEKQRVGIVRALANNPRLILADEPTANLDSSAGAEIIDLLVNSARKDDRSTIIASHDPRIVKSVDRVMKMEDGILTE